MRRAPYGQRCIGTQVELGPVTDLLQRPTHAPDLPSPLQLIPRLVVPLTGARRVSLLLGDEPSLVRLIAAEGIGIPGGEVVALSPGVASEALRTRHPLLVHDLSVSPYPTHPERGYATPSCMAAPIAGGARLYGVVCAADPIRAPGFSSEDFTALQLLAEYVGSSLHALLSARAQADVDSLTGVQTRRVLAQRLAEEIGRARRFGHPLSLVLVDVDDLRRINEREGHRAGDQALQRVAETIVKTVRSVDLVARCGGDEFAVILPETGARQSLLAARRVTESLGDSQSPFGERAGTTLRVSVGAATLPPSSDAEQLLEHAYQAMHLARREREGLRHWDLGSGDATSEWYTCLCRSCGRTFLVASPIEQRERRYCSNACAVAARRRVKGDRNVAIQGLRREGLTLHAIAERYGISEERVRQICEKR